jgi:hypothetical protein
MTTTVWTTAVVAVLALVPTPGPAARISDPVSTEWGTAGGPPDTLLVNPRASSIHWRGSGLGGRATREGTISMAKGGMFVIRHEQLTSGVFLIDMRQLDGPMAGEALFDVGRYPTAVFTSTGMKRVGPSRWQVSGNLELHGVTRPLTFDADVRWEELGHLVATSSVTLDRRQWEIGTRGAGIADDVADPGIQLTITLDARRKQAAVATR